MPAQPNGEEKPRTTVKRIEDLPEDQQEHLRALSGDDEILAIADSDLLPSGQYGHSRLVLTNARVLITRDGEESREVSLSNVSAAHTREFVGNGALEIHTNDGRRIELIRYSKTMTDPFQEIAERINKRLNVSEARLEADRDKISKVVAPKEDRPTYRCPNCNHPLRSASDACPKCTSKRQVMLRLMTLMRNHWGLAAVGLLLSIFFTAATLGPGLLIRELVDTALRPTEVARERVRDNAEESPTGEPRADLTEELEQQHNQGMTYLFMLGGAFFGLIAFRSIMAHFRLRTMGMLGERIVTALRSRLYRSLQRLSLSYYDREHTGRIMARVLSDTRVVQRFVVQAVQQMVINLLTVVGIAVLLFSINWKLAAIALLPIPFVVLCARFFSSRFRGIFKSVRRKFANLSASVSESISGMRVVKSFAQEDREITGFNEKNVDVYNARVSAVAARASFGPTIGFLVSLGVLAVWMVGGLQVLDGVITLGTLMLFINFMNQFYNPVRQLMNMTEAFQESATAAERVFNIMDMPSEVSDHERAIELTDVTGRIEIRDVSFGYTEGERVLKNINLTVEPGEMIGLVGQTGSGKSTLVSLVCRFYDPTRGQVLLDGQDLSDIKVKSLRGNIGMVLQDPFLFAGTIRDNIAYGMPEADEAQLIQAAKAANAHEFIMNLPDGYDSDVGERGVRLSGGEKQRISIARAILKDPAILILDEATSAVDTATEAIIQEAMDRLVHGRTTLAIAHRLSTLRNADRLVVLEGGEIVEEGTHEELLAEDGLYARLCRIQAEFAASVGAE